MANQNPLPIILIHKGNIDYLKYSLLQAKASNPNSRVILLGDKANSHFKKIVEHYEIEKSELCDEFIKVYRHFSTNPYGYEVFCMLRWFILFEFMLKNHIPKAFHLDSDVLLTCDLEKESKNFEQFDFTITRISGHSSFINRIEGLKNFCDFMLSQYKNEHAIREFEKAYTTRIQNNQLGGICDMTMLTNYRKLNPEKVGLTSLIINNSTFDYNINENCQHNYDDGILYNMKNGIKDVEIKDNIPYVRNSNNELIKFNSLHFQGIAKAHMRQYYYLLNGMEVPTIKKSILMRIKKQILRTLGKIGVIKYGHTDPFYDLQLY